MYLVQFFKWETGYFNTLDITLDRGGFYLCWGCLCWVQVFYTFTSAFMVGHPSKANNFAAFAILIYGLVSITLNYAVDLQKEVFRTNDGKCHIWGKPAKYLVCLLSKLMLYSLFLSYKWVNNKICLVHDLWDNGLFEFVTFVGNQLLIVY